MSIEYYLKRLKLAYYDKHLSIYNKDVDKLLTPHFLYLLTRAVKNLLTTY